MVEALSVMEETAPLTGVQLGGWGSRDGKPRNTFVPVALLFTGWAPERQGAPGLTVLQDAVFPAAPLVRVTKREGLVPVGCCHRHFMNALPGVGQEPVSGVWRFVWVDLERHHCPGNPRLRGNAPERAFSSA